MFRVGKKGRGEGLQGYCIFELERGPKGLERERGSDYRLGHRGRVVRLIIDPWKTRPIIEPVHELGPGEFLLEARIVLSPSQECFR